MFAYGTTKLELVLSAGAAHELFAELESRLLEPAGQPPDRQPTVYITIEFSAGDDDVANGYLAVAVEKEKIASVPF